ncbi:hypothetical protein HYW21_09420 [Candidatus Woesearchaeota archaeon]|nr:hypothetical protein [Candidatus Woesearchaeota archaeon]
MRNLERIVTGLVVLGAAAGVDKDPAWYLGAAKQALAVPYTVGRVLGHYGLDAAGDAIDNAQQAPLETVLSAVVAYAAVQGALHLCHRRRRAPTPLPYGAPPPPGAPPPTPTP